MRRALTIGVILGLLTCGQAAASPGGPLKVKAPNGGESWPLGGSKQITWSPGAATGIVRIELYRNGTAPANKVGVIAPSVAATAGTYSWTVGSYLGATAPAGDGYTVMVISTTPALQDASDHTFTITTQGQAGGFKPQPGQVTPTPAPQRALVEGPPLQPPLVEGPPVKILRPVAGETWWVGETSNVIHWTADTKPDDKFTVDLCTAGGAKVRTLLHGAAQPNADGSWSTSGGVACNDPEGAYRILITSWDARKATTSGLVHAFIKANVVTKNIPVAFQNGYLCWGNKCSGDHIGVAGRARAGFSLTDSEGLNWHRNEVLRCRLTFDLSWFQDKHGTVDKATLWLGDLNSQGNLSEHSCVRWIQELRQSEVDTWNAFRAPGVSAELYPLTGRVANNWEAGGTVDGGTDITLFVQRWIDKVQPNLGFVVTGKDESFVCEMPDHHSDCQRICVSYFLPTMQVTFHWKPLNPCSSQ